MYQIKLNKLLGRIDVVHLFCQKCNGNFRRVFSSVTRLETKVDKLEGQQTEMNNRMKETDDRIASLKLKVGECYTLVAVQNKIERTKFS